MPRLPPLVDTRILRPTEAALALDLVTDLELLRLKTLARWYARGLLPVVTWEDLLQEALTRILVGSRQVADGVSTVAFVAGVMRSLRSEYWRRIGNPRSTRRSARGPSTPSWRSRSSRPSGALRPSPESNIRPRGNCPISSSCRFRGRCRPRASGWRVEGNPPVAREGRGPKVDESRRPLR
jgi:hypothetical protein